MSSEIFRKSKNNLKLLQTIWFFLATKESLRLFNIIKNVIEPYVNKSSFKKTDKVTRLC